MTPPDTGTLVDAYKRHADWESQRERAENTHEVVQTLAEELLDTREETGSTELTALYNLVQHDNIYGHEEKRGVVDQFDIDSDARDWIERHLNGAVGIVGSGTYTVDVDGHEEAATAFLDGLVHAGSRFEIEDAIEWFAAEEISGIQAGIVSALVYALYPTDFPLANGPAREGMADYFDRDVSDRLSDYLDTAETFREVREEYGFNDDFRHLDYFFQWATDNPTGDPSDPKIGDLTDENADAYWVTQSDIDELESGFLRAEDDDHYTHKVDRLTEGDVVFHNFDGEVSAVSVATGELTNYRKGGDEYEAAHVSTQTLRNGVPKSQVTEELNHDPFRLDSYYPVTDSGTLNQGYLFELSDAAANFLLAELDIENFDPDSPKKPDFPRGTGPTGGSSDPEELDIPEESPHDYDTIERQLETTGQVVLHGPPGTGKTYTATQAARQWVAENTPETPRADQVRTVTFHPSFAYEDFVEGLTADTTDDGDVTYEVESGILTDIADDARKALNDVEDPAEAPEYVLVIDEINRGDLPQILGEAITLLEPGERDRHAVDLAHSGEEFSLPPNLTLIGTMNTADQSIALVDAALRRRFRFVHVPPAPDRVPEIENLDADPRSILTDDDGTASRSDKFLAASILALETLNERIRNASRLERGNQLGHTTLLGHDDPQGLADAWQYELLPQLAEYYYGQFDRLREELFESDSTLFDWERGRVAALDIETLYDALCTLADVTDPVPLVADAGSERSATTADE